MRIRLFRNRSSWRRAERERRAYIAALLVEMDRRRP